MERSLQLLVVGIANSLLLAAILVVLLLRDTTVVVQQSENDINVTTERGRVCAEQSDGMLAYVEYQECVLGQ